MFDLVKNVFQKITYNLHKLDRYYVDFHISHQIVSIDQLYLSGSVKFITFISNLTSLKGWWLSDTRHTVYDENMKIHTG